MKTVANIEPISSANTYRFYSSWLKGYETRVTHNIDEIIVEELDFGKTIEFNTFKKGIDWDANYLSYGSGYFLFEKNKVSFICPKIVIPSLINRPATIVYYLNKVDSF